MKHSDERRFKPKPSAEERRHRKLKKDAKCKRRKEHRLEDHTPHGRHHSDDWEALGYDVDELEANVYLPEESLEDENLN